MPSVILSDDVEFTLSTMDEESLEAAHKLLNDLKHWNLQSKRWRARTQPLVLGRTNPKTVYQLRAEGDLILFFEFDGKAITVTKLFHQDTVKMVRQSIRS